MAQFKGGTHIHVRTPVKEATCRRMGFLGNLTTLPTVGRTSQTTKGGHTIAANTHS